MNEFITKSPESIQYACDKINDIPYLKNILQKKIETPDKRSVMCIINMIYF